MTRTVGIMQPTYLPWLGYFEMIDASDIFIFLDDVQFQKKSWQQRNQIKGTSGEIMLTVPVRSKGRRFQLINEVGVNNQEPWAKKHLRSIEVAYAKSPHLDAVLPRLREIYAKTWDRLAILDATLIRLLMELLGIDTPVVLSSDFGIAATGNEKIATLCREVSCGRLYDAAGAVEFIDDAYMQNADIEVVYQKYVHPVYNQLHGAFLPYMSVIDLILNEGSTSLDILRSGAVHNPI